MSGNLQALFRERLYRHPILAAMADRVDWSTVAGIDNAVTVELILDGPSLPEKYHGQVLLPTLGSSASVETIRALIDDFLMQIEAQVAQEMKRIGTGR